ncbi:MAG: hypothetical protein LBG57_07875 [Treponema sp.]|nr:hypothetical protein [Treponema sp.]
MQWDKTGFPAHKASLKDLKAHNRQVIMETILGGCSTSRIGISRKTGLSPSTVTGIVAELIEQGILMETGEKGLTKGRSSKELSVNSGYGQIVIIEIKRTEANMSVYDMALQKTGEFPIIHHRAAGNSLFPEIVHAIQNRFGESGIPLAGIGLLYMEDMEQSDLNVMYSTSLYSDNISIKDALYTRFKVPVIGEYAMNELTAGMLSPEAGDRARNNAQITIVNNLLESVTVNGRQLKLKSHEKADATPLLDALGRLLSGFTFDADAIEMQAAGSMALRLRNSILC